MAARRPRPPQDPSTLLPLAEAKLAPPRLHAEIVSRQHVFGTLDAAAEAALTLVAAPPGYGKTTAVRAWCASRSAALAWVTLDAGDNDPSRLWAYIATAVDRVRQGLGRGALQALGAAGSPAERAVDTLMNGIAAFRDELVLVLDDLQHVTDRESLASLRYALERLPPNARIIAMTRIDPELRLASLRARGDLVEVRADDLAFSGAEAYELLVERGRVPLEAKDVDMLRERTSGWAAALYLAALWLRTVDEPGDAVRSFGGSHRFVADYLNQEVLDSLDDERRDYVLKISVLGRFTAELCDDILERTDSAAVLDELERSNLLVTRLEHGGWYSVHPLFAEFAEFQLASREGDAPGEIHRRAAEWYDARALPLEAVEHAAAAEDARLVARILSRHHLALVRSGRARMLLERARSLCDDQLVEHPELVMAAATAAALAGGRTIEQRRFLRLAEEVRTRRPERFTPYVEAGIALVRAATIEGGVAAAVAAGEHAVEIALRDADDILVAALGGYAHALYFSGDADAAADTALRAIEHPEAERRPTGQALARATRALAEVDQGRVASARAHAERAKALVGKIGSSRSWLGANASAALGAVLAAEGKLAEAERELAYAEHFFRDEVPTLHHAWALVLVARIRCRRGRLDEASSTIRLAHGAIAALRETGRVASLAEDVAGELQDAIGRAAGGEITELPSVAELAVLRLLDSDLSAREIGETLFLSQNTVRSHTQSIYRKLGVNSRAQAVARTTALGLLEGAPDGSMPA